MKNLGIKIEIFKRIIMFSIKNLLCINNNNYKKKNNF